jgi:hypothetical protein
MYVKNKAQKDGSKGNVTRYLFIRSAIIKPLFRIPQIYNKIFHNRSNETTATGNSGIATDINRRGGKNKEPEIFLF